MQQKYKVGDRVRFLNEVGGGVIVRLADSRMAIVQNEDGFELPTLLSELLPDVPMVAHFKQPVATRQPSPALPVQEKPKPSPYIPLICGEQEGLSLHLGFASLNPTDAVAGPFELYLINAGGYNIQALMARYQEERIVTFFAGRLPAKHARRVTVVEANELEAYRKLHFQALFYKQEAMPPISPEECDIPLDPLRFTRPGSFQNTSFLETPLLVVSIRDAQKERLLDKLTAERLALEAAQTLLQAEHVADEVSNPQQERIIDLHIEALTRGRGSVFPANILQYQLREFEEALDAAIANSNVKKLIAIHGIGHGELRTAVIATIKRKYPFCEYQDASFKEYGYGATMVIIR
jgi:hypothetical protein